MQILSIADYFSTQKNESRTLKLFNLVNLVWARDYTTILYYFQAQTADLINFDTAAKAVIEQ